MKIAIILSVSDYNNVPSLIGCKTDATHIHNILSRTNNFDDILYINETMSSAETKEELTNFISKHKGDDIEELFFYYTGHGQFLKDEFYYVLSDFDKNKRSQTTLQNEEIDNLFKSLKPNLVVKVIDACESGTQYVKNIDGVRAHIKKSVDRFNNCYFLSSSLNSQSSFQSDEISHFTLSFINAIKNHGTTTIRYKDIVDFISDEFEESPLQTPFFVIQASMTEKFCNINDSLREYFEQDKTIITQEHESTEIVSRLVDKVKKQAEDYLSRDVVISLIEKIKTRLNDLKLDDDLSEIFNLQIAFKNDYADIVDPNTIAEWLHEHPNEYFARPKYRRVRKDRFTNIFGNLSIPNILGEIHNPQDYETIRDGFELEVEVPYKTIIFSLDSKFPNIDSYTARMIYLLSMKKMRIFYFYTELETKNWDERVLNEDIEWSTAEFVLKDAEGLMVGLEKFFLKFVDTVRIQIEEKISREDDEQKLS